LHEGGATTPDPTPFLHWYGDWYGEPRKVTITLPNESVDAIRGLVAAGHADSDPDDLRALDPTLELSVV